MSQLGRCTRCNGAMMTVKGTDGDGKEVQIDVCPTCTMKPKVEKSMDKFGMEELKK